MKHYNHISQCRDGNMLLTALDEEQLDFIEESIEEYENLTDAGSDAYVEKYDGYPVPVQWYEGCLDTPDLIEFMTTL